jgi:hypothetical protein
MVMGTDLAMPEIRVILTPGVASIQAYADVDVLVRLKPPAQHIAAVFSQAKNRGGLIFIVLVIPADHCGSVVSAAIDTDAGLIVPLGRVRRWGHSETEARR